jgi:hypothetical protein
MSVFSLPPLLPVALGQFSILAVGPELPKFLPYVLPFFAMPSAPDLYAMLLLLKKLILLLYLQMLLKPSSLVLILHQKT